MIGLVNRSRNFILITALLACLLLHNSCTKTETIYTPSETIFPGSIVSSGDTTWISSPNLTYRITRTSPCYPSNEVYYFKIISTAFPANAVYSWDFGDGHWDSTAYVQHYYGYGNVYTVILKVWVNGKIVQQITTAVKPYGQHVSPVASFGCSLNDYRDPNYVAFNAQSSVTSGSIVNYFWDWKDGTTSNVATPYTEHRFPDKNKDTSYKVKLIVTSHAGCQSSFGDSLIFVPASYTNVGGISYTKTSACYPDSQIFTFTQDVSTLPNNAIYEWDFGDGTKLQYGNPIKHHYVYSKTYSIVCTIKVPGVKLREIYRNTSVYALGDDIEPIPYINLVKALNNPTNTMWEFNGWAKVGDGHFPRYLTWDFGDGAKDTRNSPYSFHTYTASGTYNVKLIVTATSGCTDSTSIPIIVP